MAVALGEPAERHLYTQIEQRDMRSYSGIHADISRIKKAYRRKALELHPDRNYGDVENATIKFAEIQSAYEVLSDPQERAWYDSHRVSILGGGEATEDHFEENVRMTSAAELSNLIGRFNASVPFTDAPNGFYGILQQTFASLAKEETAACEWDGLDIVDYPEFGSADDDYDDVVKPFYRVWGNFSTQKSFSWKDVYRTSDAPDRATRRLIEKENRKFRDEAKAEFNDAVRHLVMFARKRDPRYTPNSQTQAERQKYLRDAASAQAARSRAANLAKMNDHVIPDWAQAKTDGAHEGTIEDSEEESEVEQIECVICQKIFKSENQYEAHTKSKKHVKAVQQIQKQMRKENKTFALDTPVDRGSEAPSNEFEKLNLDTGPEEQVGPNNDVGPEPKADKDQDGKEPVSPTDDVSEDSTKVSDTSDIDDDYVSREAIASRLTDSPLTGSYTPDANDFITHEDLVTPDKKSQMKPLGKAKAKRAKKAAQQEAAQQEELEVSPVPSERVIPSNKKQFKCVTCHEGFPSKSKLFNHIKELDHAQPVAKTGNVKKKRKN
ncbi:Heat shock N-terminal protein [Rutstroemia sp. NJR-2017a BVV2]|nr:Heat shock N-terminal protein [Rutstroemia sp. NJR-2017a BVV2]